MTPRQKDMLDAIRDLTVDGVSPRYEDLRVHLGIASKSGVNRMIVALEAQGHIRRLKGRRRTLQIMSTVVPGQSTAQIAAEICSIVWEWSGRTRPTDALYPLVLGALR